MCTPPMAAHVALDESLTLPSDMGKTTTRSSWKIPSAGACPRCAARFSFLFAVGLMLECSACGKPAEKRCSRCKLEWYCSRWAPFARAGMRRVTCCCKGVPGRCMEGSQEAVRRHGLCAGRGREARRKSNGEGKPFSLELRPASCQQ